MKPVLKIGHNKGMKPLLDAHEMRQWEGDAIERWGISSLVLQEHAALGALALLPPGKPLYVLAGPGNNGGDALALARLAHLKGYSVQVWPLQEPSRWQGDAAVQARLWEGLGQDYHMSSLASALPQWRGWVVDGLFGLGARLPLKDKVLEWVETLNTQLDRVGCSVLALDLPTGLDPSAGSVSGPVLVADLTACFGHLKRCHGFMPARSCCGKVHVVALPLPMPSWTPHCQQMEVPHLPKRPWDTHKGEQGRVGILAGSPGMSGAAVMAAWGALRMGAGLVTVMTDPSVRAEIAAQVPQAMVREWTGSVPPELDVLLVGPGGQTAIPPWNGPLVLDASALQAGEGPHWMQRPDTVMTPHGGEFARLFGFAVTRCPDERLRQAAAVAKGEGLFVLKGPQTLVVGGGKPWISVSGAGNPGLATGGTGDLLAGMVAAAVAKSHCMSGGGLSMRQWVEAAVWLHGAAGDRLGLGPFLVQDVAESVTRCFANGCCFDQGVMDGQ